MRSHALLTLLLFSSLVAVAADPPGTDAFGDPLPAGAVSRIGTKRFAIVSGGYGSADHAHLLPDGKGAVLLTGREIQILSTETGLVTEKWKLEQPKNSYETKLIGVSAAGKVLIGFDHGIQTYDLHGRLESEELVPGRELPAKPDEAPKGKRLPLVQSALNRTGTLAATWHVVSPYGDEAGEPLKVIVWQPADRKKVAEVSTPLDIISSCRLSADGKKLVLIGQRKPPKAKGDAKKEFDTLATSFLVFDVGTGKEVCRGRVATGTYASVLSVAIAADGTTVYTTNSEDGTVQEWDATTGKPRRRFLAADTIGPLDLSADGKTLIGTSLMNAFDSVAYAFAWDLTTGELVGRYPDATAVTPTKPPAASTYSAVFTDRVHLLSLPTLAPTSRYDSPDPLLFEPRFSPSSDTVLLFSQRSDAYAFDVTTGKPVRTPQPGASRKRVGVVSANGKVGFGTGIAQGNVVDLTTDRTTFLIPNKTPEPNRDGVFSTDGSRLLVSYYGLTDYEAKDPKQAALVPAEVHGGQVRVWDTAKATVVFEKAFAREAGAQQMVVSLSGDGQLAVTVRTTLKPQGELKGIEYAVWDVATGKARSTRNLDVTKEDRFRGPDRLFPIAGGTRFVVAVGEKIKVWDAATDKDVGAFEDLESVNPNGRLLSVSPDGQRIALMVRADGDGRPLKVVLFDPTGKKVGESEAVDNMVYLGPFSPNGKYLLTTTLENTHLVWDVSKLLKK